MRLDEVGLEDCTGFILLLPPRLTVFVVLARLCYESVGNAVELCLQYRLACYCCKVSTLSEPLNEALGGLLHVVWVSETLIIGRHVRGEDTGVVSVDMLDKL